VPLEHSSGRCLWSGSQRHPHLEAILRRIFGIHQLGGFAKGSVAPTATTGPSIGIVALNKSGPHEILGGGTGEFVVSGDIFLNTAVTNQPWTGS